MMLLYDVSVSPVSQFSNSDAFPGDSPLTAGKCGEIVGYQFVGGGIVGEVVEGGEQDHGAPGEV